MRIPNLGWGNTRQRKLGQTLQKGVLEPREPREGAIRKEGKDMSGNHMRS